MIWKRSYFFPALHVLVWTLLFAIPLVIFSQTPFPDIPKSFFIITHLYHIGLFYFNGYWLFPRLWNRRWWWLYIPCVIAILLISYRLKLLFIDLDELLELKPWYNGILFFPPVPFIIGSIIFRVVNNRIKAEKIEKERKAERLASELKYLRSQISPHFLFNTMTNMVALARKKSPLLESSLLRLSDILRYMLYESNQDKFSLDTEIAHLRDYIALQQLRFGEDLALNLDIKDDCAGCLIEPMLLIPFIENAFKHGVGMVSDPFIDVYIRAINNRLVFKVKNNFSAADQSKDKNSGIGLANVRNRLELLYRGKYNLNISNNGEIYEVQLNLDLS